MNRLFLSLILFGVTVAAFPAGSRQLPADTTVTTHHKVTVQGNTFAYTATAGTQPVWDEKGRFPRRCSTPTTIGKTSKTARQGRWSSPLTADLVPLPSRNI